MPELGSTPNRKTVFTVLPLLLVAYAAGFVGSQALPKGVPEWYLSIQRPVWSPPAWAFQPIWTIVYGLTGLAACFIWQAPERRLRSFARAWFFILLVLSAVWPWTFFDLQRPGFAGIEAVFATAASAATAVLFGRI